MIAIVCTVAGVGVIDLVSTPALDMLYVLPVVLATARISSRFGTVVALEAATMWTLVSESEHGSVGTSVIELVLSALVLIAIVAIVSELQEALGATRASEQRAKDFLGYAAHQIRSPLTGLRTCAETLMLSGVSDQQQPLLAHIGNETERMGRLLASMLRLARLDQGEVFTRSRVDLCEVCRKAVVSTAAVAEPGVEVRLSQPSVPCVALIDPEAVAEALANLLDNAVRHAVSIVEVSIARCGDACTVAVRDDGPGLPVGAEHQVFERFVSLDGHGGSGLGLAIARALAERQEGALRYVDRSFVMSLPAA